MVYSDGVSDNLFVPKKEFKVCIARYLTEQGIIASLSSVADCIAMFAYYLGKDPNLDGPFAQGARQAGLMYPGGGKHDDITVTVGQIFVDVEGQPRREHRDFHI